MLYVEITESDAPAETERLAPIQEAAPGCSQRAVLEQQICRYAICSRYGSGCPITAPQDGDAGATFRVGDRWLNARLETGKNVLEAPVRPRCAVIGIDHALNVIAATGDEHGGWGPHWSMVEVRDAVEEGWGGYKAPLALHAENGERTLHVLWASDEGLTTADTSPTRWAPLWAAIQNWVIARNGAGDPTSPAAWPERVRPLGPLQPRQRHVGAVTA
jgi:hypothetical protein